MQIYMCVEQWIEINLLHTHIYIQTEREREEEREKERAETDQQSRFGIWRPRHSTRPSAGIRISKNNIVM